MASKPRVHFPTVLYQVIVRGNQRQSIFLDEKDFRTYLARKLTGSLVKDIARYFQREPMTISEAVIKIESLVERDMVLVRRIEDRRNNLMKRGKKKYLITVA